MLIARCRYLHPRARGLNRHDPTDSRCHHYPQCHNCFCLLLRKEAERCARRRVRERLLGLMLICLVSTIYEMGTKCRSCESGVNSVALSRPTHTRTKICARSTVGAIPPTLGPSSPPAIILFASSLAHFNPLGYLVPCSVLFSVSRWLDRGDLSCRLTYVVPSRGYAWHTTSE